MKRECRHVCVGCRSESHTVNIVLLDMEVASTWQSGLQAADLITSDVDAWGPSPGNDLKINLIITSNWLTDLMVFS